MCVLWKVTNCTYGKGCWSRVRSESEAQKHMRRRRKRKREKISKSQAAEATEPHSEAAEPAAQITSADKEEDDEALTAADELAPMQVSAKHLSTHVMIVIMIMIMIMLMKVLMLMLMRMIIILTIVNTCSIKCSGDMWHKSYLARLACSGHHDRHMLCSAMIPTYYSQRHWLCYKSLQIRHVLVP